VGLFGLAVDLAGVGVGVWGIVAWFRHDIVLSARIHPTYSITIEKN
jgi:hypothetical protein